MILAYMYFKNRQKKSSSSSSSSGKNSLVAALFDTEVGKATVSFIFGMALSTLFYQQCDGVDCVKFRGPIYDEVEDSVFVYENECVQNKVVPVDCDVSKRILPFADHTPKAPMQKNTTFPTKVVPASKLKTPPPASATDPKDDVKQSGQQVLAAKLG